MTTPRKRVDETLDAILEEGILLCVRLDDAGALVPACRAALRGGLRGLEITLTSPGALDAIRVLSGEERALVGAGTVLSTEDVAAVAEAGARFILSPVFDAAVLEAAECLGLLAIPGAATPREILEAHRSGARVVKVFPSGALGGPAFLRALRGPLPGIPILPTSGPTAENLADYLDAGAAAVGVGAEVLPPDFTLDGVERASRRLRSSLEAARLGRSLARTPGARVSVTPIHHGGGVAQGVACAWQGGQYVTIVAPRGMVACGIFDPAVCETFAFPVAMAHGSPEAPLAEPDDVLRATVDTVSSSARALGIEPGMTGGEALRRLMDD